MTSLVDDHLLFTYLLTEHVDGVDGPLATTGLWYHRLCRAVLASPVTGAMSRRLGGVGPELAEKATKRVVDLPPEIGLISLRDLAAPMAHLLGDGHRLNLLSLEALAAAEHLDARICLAEDDANPPLVDAARRRGVAVEIVPR